MTTTDKTNAQKIASFSYDEANKHLKKVGSGLMAEIVCGNNKVWQYAASCCVSWLVTNEGGNRKTFDQEKIDNGYGKSNSPDHIIQARIGADMPPTIMEYSKNRFAEDIDEIEKEARLAIHIAKGNLSKFSEDEVKGIKKAAADAELDLKNPLSKISGHEIEDAKDDFKEAGAKIRRAANTGLVLCNRVWNGDITLEGCESEDDAVKAILADLKNYPGKMTGLLKLGREKGWIESQVQDHSGRGKGKNEDAKPEENTGEVEVQDQPDIETDVIEKGEGEGEQSTSETTPVAASENIAAAPAPAPAPKSAAFAEITKRIIRRGTAIMTGGKPISGNVKSTRKFDTAGARLAVVKVDGDHVQVLDVLDDDGLNEILLGEAAAKKEDEAAA